MDTIIKSGSTRLLRVRLCNSGTGQGLTGLAYNTSGLVIGTIANNEPTAVAYTAAGSTIETVSTLGTYAPPSATKCRFREVDATNHPGLYEIHLAAARFAVASATELRITVSGAANLLQQEFSVRLIGADLDAATIDANVTKYGGTAGTFSAGKPSVNSSEVVRSGTYGEINSQTVLTGEQLSGGSPIYAGYTLVSYDVSDSNRPSARRIVGYATLSGLITIDSANDFTVTDGDTYEIYRVPAQLETIRTDAANTYARLGAPAGASIAADIAASGSSGPILQRTVSPNRILQVKDRGDGSYGTVGSLHVQGSQPKQLWALEFKGTQLPPGQNLYSMSAPSVTGADAAKATIGSVEGTSYGLDHTQAKFEFQVDATGAADDEINAKITVKFSSADDGIDVYAPVVVRAAGS